MEKLVYDYVGTNGEKEVISNLPDALNKVAEEGGSFTTRYEAVKEKAKCFKMGQTGVSRSQYERGKNHD